MPPLRINSLVPLARSAPYTEEVSQRVQHAMPPWLNSSMHLLNDLPALNTTAGQAQAVIG